MAIKAHLYSQNFGVSSGGVSPDFVDDIGLNDQFCFDIQQKQQEQFMQQQNYKQLQVLQQKDYQNLYLENSGLLLKNNNHQLMGFSQSLSNQMEKQKQEIDQYIKIQNERLRWALLEQMKQQLSTILKKYESIAHCLIRQKDEEIAKAFNRNLELENLLRQVEIESQTWQKIAKENEETVMSLNNTIEKLRESAVCLSNNGIEDAESCCDLILEEKAVRNRGFQENSSCKVCHYGDSCVILLPCRHLCSCKACEAFLDSCPICGMVKKSSIEALF